MDIVDLPQFFVAFAALFSVTAAVFLLRWQVGNQRRNRLRDMNRN